MMVRQSLSSSFAQALGCGSFPLAAVLNWQRAFSLRDNGLRAVFMSCYVHPEWSCLFKHACVCLLLSMCSVIHIHCDLWIFLQIEKIRMNWWEEDKSNGTH